jgi:hypothetical protein
MSGTLVEKASQCGRMVSFAGIGLGICLSLSACGMAHYSKVRVHVIDARTQSPIRGAIVRSDYMKPMLDMTYQHKARKRTDAEGYATISVATNWSQWMWLGWTHGISPQISAEAQGYWPAKSGLEMQIDQYGFATNATGALKPFTIELKRMEIKEKEVVFVLDAVLEGIRNRDPEAIVANYDTHAIITADIEEGGFRHSLRETRQQYLTSLGSLRDFEKVKIQRTYLDVTLNREDPPARSSSNFTEIFRLGNARKRSVTAETASFKRIEGRVLIVEQHSHVLIERLNADGTPARAETR